MMRDDRMRFRGAGLILALLIVMGNVTRADAGLNVWTGLGPPSEVEVDGFAIDPINPDNMYAASDASGFFKSIDGGATWQLTNTDIVSGVGGNALPVVIDPNFSTTLYAGGFAGMFTSGDAGATWTDITEDLPIDTDDVIDIAAAPTAPTTIYVVMSGGTVYKQTVGAASWTEIDADIPDLTIGIALSPQRPTTLYAATSSSGVFKSTDAGASWNDTTNNLADTSPTAIISLPANANVVYVGTSSGLFASNNGGASWAAAAAIDSFGTISIVALYPSHTTTLYVATDADELFVSTTGGTKWTEIDAALPAAAIHTLATDPTSASTVYVGTDVGISKSTDTGTTWQDVNLGFSTAAIYALAFSPTASSTIYTATDSGVLQTTDAGITWVDTGLPAVIGVVAIDPTHPATVYAGGSPLFRSTDAGNTWDDLMVDPSLSFTALAVDPTNASRLFAGTTDSGVLTSTDGGATFAPSNDGLPGGFVAPLVVSQANPLTLYAAPDFGLFRSTDGASHWTEVDAGLPDGSYVNDFALEPAPSTSMYAAAYDGGALAGLFKSTDRGANWTLLDATLHEPLATDAMRVGTLYAVGDDGVMRTTDGGTTWLRLGLQGPTITRLAVDPMNSAKLYAGTDSQGIFTIELTSAFVTPTPLQTPTVTGTPPTPTGSPMVSATPTLSQSTCVGDCDGHGTVTVDELVIGVNVALGNLQLALCPAFDRDHNNKVTVDELVLGVNAALNGCPSA